MLTLRAGFLHGTLREYFFLWDTRKTLWAVIISRQKLGTKSVELESYFPILCFFAIGLGLTLAIVLLSYVRAQQKPDPEKNSSYECGFDPLTKEPGQFDVRFYLVGILFIIFDLEIAFLFPWALTFKALGWVGFGAISVFLLVLTIGFIYEWKKGALDWE